MGMCTCVLWDFNGTILDDVSVCVWAFNQMLSKRDLPTLSMERYRMLFDFPVEKIYRASGLPVELEGMPALLQEFLSLYQPATLHTHLREGVLATMDALQEKGIHQVLLSASLLDNLQEQVHHFGLQHRFAKVLGLDDIQARSKKEIAMQWIQQQKIDPSQIMMLGDTVHDHEVAQSLGCDCTLLLGGHHPLDKLQNTLRPVYSNVPAWWQAYAGSAC